MKTTALAFSGAVIVCILGSSAAMAQTQKPATKTTKEAVAKVVEPAPATTAHDTAATYAASAAAIAALQTQFDQAREFNLAGNSPQAVKIWQDVYVKADKSPEQQKLAAEAAKMLGFNAIENRNPRETEAYFAAEAIISRRLFMTGNLNARNFSMTISHWATGAGAMGRSSESAALVYFAREVKARAMAMESQKVLNREATFSADSVEGVRVSGDNICSVSSIELLKAQVSCTDEASALNEALSLQARQIKADAPPPIVKKDDKDKDK